MKGRETVLDLAESLGLPPEAAAGVLRLTLLGRRQAMVEHHRGLLSYSGEAVEVSGGRDRLRLLGRDLLLRAMDRETLLISGTITAVEYE